VLGWILAAAATTTLLACASSPPPAASNQPVAESTPFQTWSETTRAYADDLLEEARREAEAGNFQTALDRVDDALCLALDPPEGIADDSRYLEFVAGLLADAEDLERQMAEAIDGEPDTEQVVVLPPIELPDPEIEPDTPVDPDGLPVSAYPLELNTTVESFLDAMTGNGEYRRRIENGLGRAGRYLPMIRSKLDAAGLPAEISYLPLIESSFSVKAYSRARAHGMWQFISSTGRHYGLEIGSLVDERRDPVRSTEAAVAYLSDLYAEFGDWHLSLAAYNSGAGNVRRAIRRSGSRDFWVLKRYLPRETRNYVPAFIASVIIAKEPGRWGFAAPVEQPWTYDRVDVPDALDLQFVADRTNISLDDLRALNPAIRRDLTPAGRTTALWLNAGDGNIVSALLAETPRSDWAPRMIHTVRRGDSLSTIAARYGSSVGAIKQANGLRGSLIHPGQGLIVPRLGVVDDRPDPRRSEDGVYVVQTNDTLWDIARSFGVSVDELCAANSLGRRQVIRPGQRLNLPTGASSVATASSAGRWSGRYTVRSGDTLSGIASRYRVSVAELRRVNGLSGSRIYPGNTLRVPGTSASPAAPGAATTYRVRKGDTLYDIAREFGVSVSELRRLNGLSGSRIYPGDVLRIPPRQRRG
jgi:membrane-bound lytic murein transglycosylase D